MSGAVSEKNDWVSRVLGVTLPPGGSHTEDPAIAQLRAAYQRLGPALETVAQMSAGLATSVADGRSTFEAALAEGDIAAAREQLFELGALSKRTAPSGDGVREGLVAFGKLRLDWDAAKRTVGGQLAALREAIEDDETEEDEADEGGGTTDGPVFTAAVARLDAIMANFNRDLGKTLDQLAVAADANSRGRLARQTGDISAAYLATVTGRLARHIDANPYKVPVALEATLSEPLRRMRELLARMT